MRPVRVSHTIPRHINTSSHSSSNVSPRPRLSHFRRPAIGWLQFFIVLFWTISPAIRTNAIYVPDSAGNPYWLPEAPSYAGPPGVPDYSDNNQNGTADWQDNFQDNVNNGTLTWWAGGSFMVDGVAVSFPAQWCVAQNGVARDSDGDGIPDGVDPYPNDATNNSYWWPGGQIVLNNAHYLIRSQCFAGTGADSNNNGVPDCMESALMTVPCSTGPAARS